MTFHKLTNNFPVYSAQILTSGHRNDTVNDSQIVMLATVRVLSLAHVLTSSRPQAFRSLNPMVFLSNYIHNAGSLMVVWWEDSWPLLPECSSVCRDLTTRSKLVLVYLPMRNFTAVNKLSQLTAVSSPIFTNGKDHVASWNMSRQG